jgi:crotonobetainyl-CoA:carnitine CoA-transferase CaiB-like acyl-CoA transferase
MTTRRVAETIWEELTGSTVLPAELTVTGEGALASVFPVTDFAAGAVAAAGLATAELLAAQFGAAPAVTVDRRLAAFWFGWSLRPIGWELPSIWHPIAGDYRTADGWIRIHANAPRHRDAALRVLGGGETRDEVAARVAAWTGADLESAIVAAGGCSAEMRSMAAWADHPQGAAVAAEPLAHISAWPAAPALAWRPSRDRPLQGVRVLDLTRILAGPIATRRLAGLGAEVLRIDPPGWDEPGVIPEITLGKRCARLDLEVEADRRTFEALLSQADVLVHGYRPGALDGLGYGENARRRLAPRLIEASLCAYGWTGPWSRRRGFDSLVQMSSGIAQAGTEAIGGDAPAPLPVQALDHVTGYLLAAAVIRGLTRRSLGEGGSSSRLSLARTAKLLVDLDPASSEPPLAPVTDDDLAPGVEITAWGEARRLKPPVTVEGAPLRWDLPASALGSAMARWWKS